MTTAHTPLTLLDPDGGWVNAPVHVHDLRGKPVLLHFFSLSSDTTAASVSDLKAWAAEYAPRGLRVISVVSPADGKLVDRAVLDTNFVEGQAKTLGLTHPIAVDDGSMARAYSVDALPAYLVFDGEGTLRQHVSGDHATQDLRRTLEQAVDAAHEAHAF